MSLLEQWREESRNAVKKKSYSTIERETMPKKSLQAKSIRGPINKRLIDTIIQMAKSKLEKKDTRSLRYESDLVTTQAYQTLDRPKVIKGIRRKSIDSSSFDGESSLGSSLKESLQTALRYSLDLKKSGSSILVS